MQYIRSIIFIILMYLYMPILGLLFLIPAARSDNGAAQAVKTYSRHMLWLVRVLCGLRYEIRGPVPTGNVVIASKHQSFMDIIIHTATVDRVNFVMKEELRKAPVLGWYAKKLGAAPIKRGAKGAAVKQMLQGASQKASKPTQLVIYPQGTRVHPGDEKPYKIGAALLAQGLDRPVIPAATNCGLFWPKLSLLRKPGVAVVEYFDAIPVEDDPEKLIQKIEEAVEPASIELMKEAGFNA